MPNTDALQWRTRERRKVESYSRLLSVEKQQLYEYLFGNWTLSVYICPISSGVFCVHDLHMSVHSPVSKNKKIVRYIRNAMPIQKFALELHNFLRYVSWYIFELSFHFIKYIQKLLEFPGFLS